MLKQMAIAENEENEEVELLQYRRELANQK
jgi:hypothetical protein